MPKSTLPENYIFTQKKEEHPKAEDRAKTAAVNHGHPGFYELLGKMADLHSRKNHDYAGSDNPLRNFYKCRELGISPFMGVMVRLGDKASRLESFCKQDILEVSNESVEDTLMDQAVYSLLAILLFREEHWKGKEQGDATVSGTPISNS